MPNIAATGGTSGFCHQSGSAVSKEDTTIASSIFNAIGKTVILQENLMDAVTDYQAADQPTYS